MGGGGGQGGGQQYVICEYAKFHVCRLIFYLDPEISVKVVFHFYSKIHEKSGYLVKFLSSHQIQETYS